MFVIYWWYIEWKNFNIRYYLIKLIKSIWNLKSIKRIEKIILGLYFLLFMWLFVLDLDVRRVGFISGLRLMEVKFSAVFLEVGVVGTDLMERNLFKLFISVVVVGVVVVIT